EQTALAGLTVFRGGFDVDAGVQVVGASAGILSALVDKSLLHRVASGAGSSRYDMHEFVRQNARDRLHARDQLLVRDEGVDGRQIVGPVASAVQDRHCCYYAKFLAQREESLTGAAQKQALDDIEREIDNVRAAWQWAVSRSMWPEVAASLHALFLFYRMKSRFEQGRAAFQEAVAALERSAIRADTARSEHRLLWARLLSRQARLTDRWDEREMARALLEKSLAILRDLDEGDEHARTLMWLGDHLAGLRQEREKARRLLEESLALCQETGDRHMQAEVLQCLARLDRRQGASAPSCDLYRQSLSILRLLGDRDGIANSLFGLALASDWRQAYQEIEQLLEESLSIRRDMGNRSGEAWCLHHLAELARGRGDYARAKQLYQAGLDVFRDLGDPQPVENALRRMSTVVAWLGEYDELEPIYQECLTIASRLENRSLVAASLEGIGTAAHLKGDYARARRYYRESLSLGRELDHSRIIAWSFNGIGDADFESGHVARAQDHYRKSLAICREQEIEDGIPMSLLRLGSAECALGELVSCRAHLAEALAFEIGRDFAGGMLSVLVASSLLLAKDGRPADALELGAFILGQPQAWRETRDKAQRLVDELAAELPPPAVAATREWEKEKGVAEVCEAVLAWLKGEGT
ncbi:MAG: tetratricopeptide repeat protein, partial [Anaerolineae bacterium]|nr:tetratricopeptide repeat protein [Anaerolineae bacterium]